MVQIMPLSESVVPVKINHQSHIKPLTLFLATEAQKRLLPNLFSFALASTTGQFTA